MIFGSHDASVGCECSNGEGRDYRDHKLAAGASPRSAATSARRCVVPPRSGARPLSTAREVGLHRGNHVGRQWAVACSASLARHPHVGVVDVEDQVADEGAAHLARPGAGRREEAMCRSSYGPRGAPERIARFAAPMATPRLLPAKGKRTVAVVLSNAAVTA